MNMIPSAPAAPAAPGAPASTSGTKAGVDVATAFAALVEALSGEFLAAENVAGESTAADAEAAPGDQPEEADETATGLGSGVAPAAPVPTTQVPAPTPAAPAVPEPDAAAALRAATGGTGAPGPDATSDAGTTTVAAPAVAVDAAADDGAPTVPSLDAPGPDVAPTPAGTVEQETQTPDGGSQHPEGNQQLDGSEPVVARPAPAVAPPTDAPRDGAAPVATAVPTSPTTVVEGPSNVTAPVRSEAPALPDQLVRVLTPLRKGPDGTHRVAIQLRPDDLGEVQVDVRVRGNEIALTLRADLVGTTDLLRSTLSELRAELEAAGFRAGDLDVADHQPRDGAGREVDDPTRGRDRSNRPATETQPDRTADRTPGAPAAPVPDAGPNNLDLRL